MMTFRRLPPQRRAMGVKMPGGKALVSVLAVLGAALVVSRLGSTSLSSVILMPKGDGVATLEREMHIEHRMARLVAEDELNHIKSVADGIGSSSDPDAGIRFGESHTKFAAWTAAPKLAKGGARENVVVQSKALLDKEADEDRKENRKLSSSADVEDVLGAINSIPATGKQSPSRTTPPARKEGSLHQAAAAAAGNAAAASATSLAAKAPSNKANAVVQQKALLDKEVSEDREENRKLSSSADVEDVLGAINSIPAASTPKVAAEAKGPAMQMSVSGESSGAKTSVLPSSSSRVVRHHVADPVIGKSARAGVKGVKAAEKPAAAVGGIRRVRIGLAHVPEDPLWEEGSEHEDSVPPEEAQHAHEEGKAGEDQVQEAEAVEPAAAVGGRHPLGNRVFDMPRSLGGENQGDVHVPGGSVDWYMFRQLEEAKAAAKRRQQKLWFFGEGPWAHVPTEGEMSGAGIGEDHDGANGVPIDRWWSDDAVVGDQPGLGDARPVGGWMDRVRKQGEDAPTVYTPEHGLSDDVLRAMPGQQQLREMRSGMSLLAPRGPRTPAGGLGTFAPVVSLADVPNVRKCIGGANGVCGDEVLAPYTDKRDADVGFPSGEIHPYFYARPNNRQEMLSQSTGSLQMQSPPTDSEKAAVRPQAASLLKDLAGDVNEAEKEVMSAARITSPSGLWSAVWRKGNNKVAAGTKLSASPSPTNRDNIKCVGKVCGDETLDAVDNLHVPGSEVFEKGWSGWGMFNKDGSANGEMLRARPTYEDGGHLHRGESDVDATADMEQFFDRQ